MKADEIVLPYVFKLLAFSGRHPYGQKWIRNIAFAVVLICTSILLPLGFLEPFINEGGVDDVVMSFEGIGATYQHFTKNIMYQIILARVIKLLRQAEERFWPIDKFGRDNMKRLERNQRYLKNVLFGTIFIGYVACIIGFSKSLWGKRQLPYLGYSRLLTNNYFFVTVYLLEFIVSFISTPFVIGYDFLFIQLVIVSKCQLMMIKHGLKTLKMKGITTKEEQRMLYEEMRRYIIHHDFVLNFLDQLKSIYSISIMNQFVASIVSISATMFFLSAEGWTSFAFTMKCLNFIIAYSSQLFVVCLVGSQISEASEDVGSGFYESKWKDCYDPSITTAGELVIQRSQKTVVFTAGGFYDLNLEMFSTLFTSSITFLTFLENVKNKPT